MPYNDPRRRNRQAAHASRFKVKFVRPPKGKIEVDLLFVCSKISLG